MPLMPLNEKVRITIRGGKKFEDVVTDELCIIGEVYYSFKKRSMLSADAIKRVEVLKNGKYVKIIG